MTPQEVIKKFMAELNANNYTDDTSGVGTTILDDAVRSSSKFARAQSVIDAMKADQVTAEKLAVEEILGSDYAGKTISQVPSNILSAQASTYNTDYQYSGTVQDAITTRKAYIFLEQFCGIQLNTNYAVINSTPYSMSSATGNVDTGAITGSDANITLTAGDVVNGTTLTAANLTALKSKYGSAASLSGDTLVIGTGVEKDEESIVPEDGDMYLFTAQGTAKKINTGSNGWVVNATSGNDTITSGGRDSINAGTGNDKITANADEATITTGAGSDTVEISAAVKSVTITDLNSSDTIKISGTFEVGNAQIENSMLVVTDKTGTRKIKFSDLTNVGNAKIGAQKISDWLSDSGFSLSDLSSSDTSSGDVVIDDSDAGRVAIDPDYTPATPDDDFANQDSADQTQTISSATNINLDDVTISSGTLTSGNATVGTVESVSPAVMNFTTRGLTIHVGDGTATSYNALTSAQKMMVAALFKWWAGESLELNEDSYGIGFESDTAKVTDITLSFENLGGSTLALVSSQYRGGDEQVTQLQLKISTAYYSTFDPTNKNGVSSSSGAGYLDRTLAHEFTHAVMSTNINNFSYLPQFVKEGMAELTHGIDDERGYEIFSLAYNSSSLSSALSLSDTSTGNSIAYSGGYMFMRYLAKQAALQTLDDDFAPGDITATVNLSAGNGTYYVSGNSTLETATTSAQNISLGSASGSTYTVGTTGVNQMINTGSTAKNIVGVNHKTSVTGGAGNDTIQFVEGTLIDAGNGKNSIVGSGQFATITAGTGNDTVLVKGSSNSIALGDGNNLAAISSEYTYNNTITTGAGSDTVTLAASYNATIQTGAGNDSIKFGGANNTIDAGDGADTVSFTYGNDSLNVVNLGDGDDSATLLGYQNSLLGGDGKDTIFISGSNNTLEFGAGDDSIYEYSNSEGGNYFLYNADSGNDTIEMFRANDKLVIAGDYSVTKGQVYSNGYTDFVVSVIKDSSVVGTINLTAASSNFSSLNNIVTVEATDDSEENPLLISLTAGNDSYSNSVEGATIQALAGNDTIYNSSLGSDVSIDGGAGNDSITNRWGNNVIIDGGDGNDSIQTSGSNVTIDGGTGDDYFWIDDRHTNISVNAGEGHDTVHNIGSKKVTISGGAGNDSICNGNAGDSVTIDGGDGNDWIENINNSDVSIDAGAGNDSIYSHGESVTIDAGLGDDRISLGSNASLNLIQYTSGDGNDTVWGYNATSTLKIGNGTGTYSVTSSDNDIIVTVGEGSIKLVGAATLASVNISGTDETPAEEPSLLVTLTEGNDTYDNTVEGATIQALGGDDSIVNEYSAASVSIDAGAGADSIDNIASDVTISAGDDADIIQNYSDAVSIDGGNGNDTILNVTGYYNTLSGGAGNDSIVNRGITVSEEAASDDLPAGFYVGNYLTLSGGAGSDTIENEGGNNISISAGDGADEIYNVGATVSIDAGAGADEIYNVGANVSVNAGTGNDFIYNDGANVSISAGAGSDRISLDTSAENNLIQYTSGDGADTIYGYNATSTLKIGNGTGTYSTTSSGNDIIVTVGEGSVKLVGAASLSAVNISGTDATPADPAEDEFYWRFTNGTATYIKTNGTTSETLFTISGLNPDLTVDDLDSAIEISGNQIILSADVLAQRNITLTTSGSYALKLGEDCPTVTAVAKSWTLDGTTATYHDAGKTDGYKLSATAKSVTYTAAVDGAILLTVDGLASGLEVADGAIDGLEVSGKVLTVTPEVVGDELSISSGYKIVFAAGYYDGSKFTGTSAKDTIEVKGTGLIVDGGAGNDTVTSNGDGGNIYLFASANGKDTITGYGDDDTIKITDGSAVSASVSGKNIIVTVGNGSITLKDAAANGTHVLILDSDGETLIDENFYSNRIVDGNSVTLTSAFKDKTFTTNDTITAVDASATTNKFTLNGGDADETLIGGKGANFINGGGGENILTGGKGNDTFVAGGGVDTITDYSASGTNGTDKISLAADITDFSIVDGDIILNFDDGNSLTIQNGDGKKINFIKNGKSSTEIFTADGVTNTQGTAITLAATTDSYTASAKIVTIDGGLTNGILIVGNTKANKIFGSAGSDTLGGGKGNDTLTGDDGDDIFIYDAGKDVITDYTSGEDKISLTAAAISESLNSKGDVILKFSSANQLTIKGGDEIIFVTDGVETTKTYYNDRIVGADGVTLQSTFRGTTFAATDDLPKVDTSAVTKRFTLTGGNEDNTLIGGKGTNFINGGAGDDILIGNGGADTFVYSSGDDTISDYVSGTDKISLGSAMTNFNLEGDDVIIDFAEGSLTISDAAGEKITLIENGKSVVNIFAANGIFTGGKTAITLAADTSTFSAAGYSKLVSIDGGILSSDASIVGNAKANKIFAGDAGSTINGGKGNDSLWGGNGDDTFIYESGGGKDVIYDFGDGDALQIAGTFTASVKNNSIAFKVGSQTNAITLKDYTATSFNINGDTYRISGNTLTRS